MNRWLRTFGALAWLILLCRLVAPSAFAADSSKPIEGSAGPAAASAPANDATRPTVDCRRPSGPRASEGRLISVIVNAATAWQPRSGEVLVAIKGDPARFAGVYFRACFGWSNKQSGDYFSESNLASIAWQEAFVMVRPPDSGGDVNLGVTVPPLDSAPSTVFGRWFGSIRSTGLGLVPVADMRLIAYTKDAVIFDEVRPIGVTSLLFASFLTLSMLALALAALSRLVSGPRAAPARRHTIADWLRPIGSSDWILELLKTSKDGRASLSAFQMLLWTLLVAASGVYVMTLSGNLINITPGTLTLLGIAGAASLIAAKVDKPAASGARSAAPSARPESTAAPSAVGDPPTATAPADVAAGSPVLPLGPDPAAPPAVASAPPNGGRAGSAAASGAAGSAGPQWRDLVLDPDTKYADVSRAQMLLFTVVSAAFVAVQVLNYYVIPDIPVGYQILMGISNGVYVGQKLASVQPASKPAPPPQPPPAAGAG